jgi:HAMP domain-containing protein
MHGELAPRRDEWLPLVRPRGGELLPARSLWRGKEFQFDVVVSGRLAERLRRAAAAIDLGAGDLVLSDGERRDILGGRSEFEHVAGEIAPPWVFRWPTLLRPFVVPRGRLDLDVDPDTDALTYTPPATCSPVFRCLEATYLGPAPYYAPDAFTAFERTAWRPHRESLMDDIDLLAATAEAASLAKDAFAAVCEQSAAAWVERRQSVRERERQVVEVSARIIDALAAGTVADAGALREAVTLTGVDLKGAAEALRALGNAERRLRRELLPIEVVVAPAGKHFSTLPEAWALGPGASGPQRATDQNGVACESKTPFHSATVVTPARRLVFVPEDDLRGMQISSRHELYHLLEEPLLNEAQRRVIAADYAATINTAGPFARPYGYLRHEFFATLGEVFEGGYGVVGRDWLMREHPSVHQLLVEATGRG